MPFWFPLPAQLLEGRSEGACRIRLPLKVLSNLLVLGADSAVTSCLTQEGDLPHFLFDLVEGIMGNPVSQQVKMKDVVMYTPKEG